MARKKSFASKLGSFSRALGIALQIAMQQQQRRDAIQQRQTFELQKLDAIHRQSEALARISADRADTRQEADHKFRIELQKARLEAKKKESIPSAKELASEQLKQQQDARDRQVKEAKDESILFGSQSRMLKDGVAALLMSGKKDIIPEMELLSSMIVAIAKESAKRKEKFNLIDFSEYEIADSLWNKTGAKEPPPGASDGRDIKSLIGRATSGTATADDILNIKKFYSSATADSSLTPGQMSEKIKREALGKINAAAGLGLDLPISPVGRAQPGSASASAINKLITGEPLVPFDGNSVPGDPFTEKIPTPQGSVGLLNMQNRETAKKRGDFTKKILERLLELQGQQGN